MNDTARARTDSARTIKTVAWGVPPRYEGAVNRPVRLVAELTRLGVIERDFQRIFHGRSRPDAKNRRAFPLLPAVSVRDITSAAILSPLFLLGSTRNVFWWDIYDDWSLGSNFSAPFRIMARAGYWRVKHDRRMRASSTITANNEYMAERIGGRGIHVVPNGVDRHIAELATGDGDGTPTLIVLGRFIQSRTDLGLLEACMLSTQFQRIIVGAPEPAIESVLKKVRAQRPGVLEVREWISDQELAKLACPQTKALVPNLVNPYTRSQDLMKAYTFAALGIPTICPAELWPKTLEVSTALLLQPSSNLDDSLRQWIRRGRATEDERQNVVQTHSWGARAKTIASLIHERSGWLK